MCVCVSCQSWSRKQQRPSVLRQVFQTASSLQQGGSPGWALVLHHVCAVAKRLLPPLHPENVPVMSSCKEEPDASRLLQSSSPQMGSSSWQSHHQLRPPRRDSPTRPSTEERREGYGQSVGPSGGLHHSLGAARVPSRDPEGSSTLFVSGLCRWPGCDAVSEDFPSFLK